MQWMTAREDYHRLLKQVYLQGVRNNTEVEHYYEYVNFRAVTQPAAVFDPCALAPKVCVPSGRSCAALSPTKQSKQMTMVCIASCVSCNNGPCMLSFAVKSSTRVVMDLKDPVLWQA